MTEATWLAAPTEQVVLEVRRKGRRPRYHRGTRRGAELERPEACNTTSAITVVLTSLPPLRRPQTQLCRRCYPVLAVGA